MCFTRFGGTIRPRDSHIKSDYIVGLDSLNGKGNLNSRTCFVTKFILKDDTVLVNPPTLQSCILRACLLDVETFCWHVIERD